MNKDILKASAIAGGSLGFAARFLTKGEELEDDGDSTFHQVTGGLGKGVISGATGVGIGAGTTGTIMALRGILKR